MASATNVAAPPAAPPPNGLRASIEPERTDDRWANPEAVITYRPEGCNENGDADDMCDSTTFSFTAPADSVSWKPYFLSVTERCSTFGSEITDAAAARIRRLMEADTERQLAREFWEGDLAQVASLPDGTDYPNTWLANVAHVDILSHTGPVALTHGLACLDQYLNNNNSGQQGAVHATAQTVTHWAGLMAIHRENGKWYTPSGHLVIASPGYTGTDPNGNVATNNVWAYATDMPRIFLGPIQIHPIMKSIDRVQNTVESLAQRPALVEWQRCRHAGVRLAITVCDEGGS